MAARGAVLGLTMAAGVASGSIYLEQDLAAAGTPDDEAAAQLLALRGADRVALEQAARRTAGHPSAAAPSASSAGWPSCAPCCRGTLDSRHGQDLEVAVDVP
jgi:hypothetical protein